MQCLERENQEAREEWGRKRRELQKENEFMANEQNMKELEMSELREKLRKREDELRDLKSNLNGQISGVVEQYHQQL